VLSVAWLITSMYTLSWYDLMAWVPLAVLATSKLDRIMLIRGTALSLAYVPGRAIEYGAALDFTAARVRDTISPIIQMAVLLAVVLWWRQPDRPELWPIRRPSAGSTPEPVARASAAAAKAPVKAATKAPARSAANGRAGARGHVTARRAPASARSGSRRR
jgi:alpha-1,6-mannosyltransferase